MRDNILITIAIPTYNNSETIMETITSCLNQKTDINYDILIVNNGSQDDTANIINQLNDKKIYIITIGETVPIWENHNNCFKNARGQYVLFCHSDDRLEDHAIETIANKLKQRNYPKKYVLWGHSMFRDPYAVLQRAGFTTNKMIVGEYAPMVFMHGAVPPTGTCYSKASIIEVGGYLLANHRLSPSDITSHIYFGLKGFRFEMMEEMILIREFASTSTETNLEMILDALDDAFSYLIEATNENEIHSILTVSAMHPIKPYRAYYALAQDPKYKKHIKSIILRELLSRPILLKSKIVRKLLSRLFSK